MDRISPLSKDEVYVKGLEQKVKKLDSESMMLRKQNQEYEVKIAKMAQMEEQIRQYEDKTRVNESHREKADI